MENKINRFKEAQKTDFDIALQEIKNGRKESHWMWYIFPQLKGLGMSAMSRIYGVKRLTEAIEYYNDSVLGTRLVKICKALKSHRDKSASAIMGAPDDLKLKSCLTLFSQIEGVDPMFEELLDEFYSGEKCNKTLKMLGRIPATV